MRGDGPWASTPFRWLVAGRVVDTFGNAMAPVALAFAVLDLGGSPTDLGLVVAARSVANVALVLFGGVLADRWRRSVVLVWSNVLSAGTQAVVATLVLTGQATVPRLAVLGVCNGAAAAVSFPAAAALVPQTVPAGVLHAANAVNRAGHASAAVLGATVGGALVALLGPGWGLALDAATFLLAGLAYAAVRSPAATGTTTGSTWEDLRTGWSAFTAHRWVWVVVLAFMVLNASWVGGLQVLGPGVADRTVGRAAWGVVLGAEAAGMVVGAGIAVRLQAARPLRRGMLAAAVPAGLLGALALRPTMLVLVPVAVVAGIAFETFGVAWETSLQTHVAPDRLARVYSYDMLGSFVAIPLGEVVVGPLAEALGTSTVLLGLAGLIVATAVATLGVPEVRDLRALAGPGGTDVPTGPTLVGS